MSNVWLRIKVWTKVIVFALLLIYISAFILQNSGRPVQLWVWRNRELQTGLLVLLLYTFVAACIVTLLVRTTFRTLWQIRQLKHRGRTEKLEREVAEMRSKAAMLRAKPSGTEPGPAAPRPDPTPDDTRE